MQHQKNFPMVNLFFHIKMEMQSMNKEVRECACVSVYVRLFNRTYELQQHNTHQQANHHFNYK